MHEKMPDVNYIVAHFHLELHCRFQNTLVLCACYKYVKPVRYSANLIM